jgi:peroxiredoxin
MGIEKNTPLWGVNAKKRTIMLRLQHIVGIFLLLLVTATSAWSVGVGEAAPDFKLTTLDGQPITGTDFTGEKPLMLVFWATWCPVCKKEIPRINQMAADFGPKGLAVLAVNVGVNDSAAKAMAYRDKYDLDYPVAFDAGSKVTRAFGVAGTPTILIMDKNGIVRYRDTAVPEDLTQHFAKLLE